MELLKTVGLEDKRDAYPNQLLRRTAAAHRHRPALAEARGRF